MSETIGKIVKISGPLVVAENMKTSNLFDIVKVGKLKLIGEIIEMHGDLASIQVYEETNGIGPGEEVVSTNSPLSIELGPGLIGNVLDGIGRPLKKIQEQTGNRLSRGIEVLTLDRTKKWKFVPTAKPGKISEGNVVGEVKETNAITIKILVPPKINGELLFLNSGEFTVEDEIGKKYGGIFFPSSIF